MSRIRELGQTQPELLVAHHYTRYLGDISGGQTLKKKAQKSWDLNDNDNNKNNNNNNDNDDENEEDENQGIRFYHFPDIPNPDNFKRMYRARLNVIGVENPDLIAEIVNESNRVFEFNVELFREMDERAKEIDGFSNVRPDIVEERRATLSPIHVVGNKVMSVLNHVTQPIIVMAVASLMTFMTLHATDII